MSTIDSLDSLVRIETLLSEPGNSHTVLLTSFRRNGQGVSSPVGMMAMDGKLYFMTPAKTGKVKRLAHTPRVTLALCTYRGRALGPAVEGTARRLAGSEAQQARRWICAGLAGLLVNLVFRIRFPGGKTAVYEVSLVPEE